MKITRALVMLLGWLGGSLLARAELVTPPTVDYVNYPATCNVGETVTISVGAHANESDNSDGNDWNGERLVIARINIDYVAPGGDWVGIYEWLPTWQSPANVSGSFTAHAPGTWYFRVRVMDGRPWYAPAGDYYYYAIQVNSPTPAITSSLSQSINQGQTIAYTITASNSPSSFSASNLPAGLSLNSSTGEITGRVTASGTIHSTITASNGAGTDSQTLAWSIAAAEIIPQATVSPSSIAFGQSLTLNRAGTTNFGFGWTENVIWRPDGQALALGNQPLGSQSYLPSMAGTYAYQFRLVDNYYNYVDQHVSFSVAKAAPSAVFSNRTYAPAAGGAYTLTANDLNAQFKNPYSFNVAPPSGAIAYTLASSGATLAAGSALAAGNSYVVRAAFAGDANYQPATADAVFTIAALAPVVTSSGSWRVPQGAVVRPYTIVASNSPTSYGASGLPAGLVVNSANGEISGSPTQAGTFAVTISATNSAGTGNLALSLTVGANDLIPSASLSATLLQPGQSLTLTRAGTAYHGVSWTENIIWQPNGTPQNLGNQGLGASTYTPAAGDGTYTYQFRLVDTQENFKDQNLTFVVDGQAPSVPGSLNVAGITTTSFTLSWAASSDNIAIAAYEVKRDSTILGSTASASYSVTGLAPATTYAMSVRSRDTAGNWSAWSAPVNFATQTPPPAITSASSWRVPQGAVVRPYTITATNSPTSYNATGLPSGLSIAASSGVISGIPTQAGVFTVTLSAGNSTGSGNLALALTVGADDLVPTASVSAPVVRPGDSLTLTRAGTAYHGVSWTENIIWPPGGAAQNLGNQNLGASTYTPTAGDGTYTYQFRLVDTQENFKDQNLTFIVDGQAPSVPAALASSNKSYDSFTLSWAAASDNVGVASYEVKRDGTVAGTTSGTNLNLTGLQSATTYAMSVRSRDTAGNYSAWSAPINVTTLIAPPVITSTATWRIPQGAVVRPYAITATNAPTAFSASGLPPGLTLDPGTGQISGVPTQAGVFTTSLGATNGSGTGTLALTITIGADDLITSASVTPLGVRPGQSVTLNRSGSAYLGVSWTENIIWRPNGAGPENLGNQGEGSSTYAPIAGDGDYVYQFRLVDTQENFKDQHITFYVDGQPPSVPNALSASGVAAGSLTLSWGAAADNRAINRYEVRRDGVSVGEVTATTFGISGLTPLTTYALAVRAQDDAGNWSAWSAPLSVTTLADTTPPSVPSGFNSPAQGPSTISLSWIASTDDVAVAGYRLTRDGTPIATVSGISYTDTGLTINTTYAYTVLAYDSSGNVSAASAPITPKTIFDPNGDEDGDGMPNGWEQQYGLNPFSGADAVTDLDGDGFTNVAEFNLHKIPTQYDQGTSSLGNAIPAGWPNAGGADTHAVGVTRGELSVDKNGAATYSIPLALTPGTGGVQPQLALNYSSNTGAGIAGFGWSLSGVSAVSRGPQTRAIDGQIKGVTLNSTDRFYLDGQRLVYVGGGSGYGTDGAEYRTELESFTKVISYGSRGSGPASFKAWTKAGLIIEFGSSDDSAFDAWGRSEVLSWSVHRISDTKGNYMVFEYGEDALNGVHQLHAINYTGNSATGLTPYASVLFDYEDRPDWAAGYVAGSPVAGRQRLKRIKSCYNNAVVRSYELNYTTREPNHRSLLASVTESAADGKSYPDLVFNYESVTEGWQQDNAFAPPYALGYAGSFNQTGSGFVDLNGDGRADFVYKLNADGPHGARLNTGSGWADAPEFELPYPLASTLGIDAGSRFVDLNGDGLPDFIWRQHGAGGNVVGMGVRLNTGAGWVNSANWMPPAAIAKDDQPLHGGRFLDLDGDGRIDFVSPVGIQGSKAFRNTGSGWQTFQGYNAFPIDYALYKGRFIDLNGDGLPDLTVSYHGSGVTQVGTWLNTGSGWAAASAYNLPFLMADDQHASTGAEFADVNGDGLPDFIWFREVGGNPKGIAINTGAGWSVQNPGDPFYHLIPPFPLSKDGAQSPGSTMLDVNGDGIVDMAEHRTIDGITYIGTKLGTRRSWEELASGSPLHLPVKLYQSFVHSQGVDFVDLNADGAIDVVRKQDSQPGEAYLNTSRASDRLVSVVNGFGVTAELNYRPLTDSSVYAKGTGSTFPVVDVVAPMHVVSQVKHQDGVGGTYNVDYNYGGLRSHAERGSLGFEWMRVTDARTGVASTTTFSQDYPSIGMPRTSITRSGAVNLSESVVTYAERSSHNGKVHFVFAQDTLAFSRDLNGSLVTQTDTYVPNPSSDIDEFGNIKKLVVDSGDGFTKTTESDFANDTGNWFLGRLTRSVVTSTAPGKPSLSRTAAFTYDGATGLLVSETVEPDKSALHVMTSYGYDAYGNKTSVTVSGEGIASRTSTTAFDARGRFATSVTNAAGHSESYHYDDALGVVTQLTGANGLTTQWHYDSFGQKTREERADGTSSDIRVKWAGPNAPAGAKYFVETESSGTAPAIVFHDAFGRAFQSLAINGTGEIVYQTTVYDDMGRAQSVSVPYRNDGSPVYWTQTSYDILGRPTAVHTPDDEAPGESVATSFSYNGLTVEATDAAGRVNRTVKNSQGQVVQTIRNANSGGTDRGEVTHAYDALGNLISTTADGATTTLEYDDRGRKTKMVDPDMGTWNYAYNVLGELIWQKDAKNQESTLGYDVLGRLVTRTEAEGTTQWTYDTSPTKGIGKLHTVTSPGGYSEQYDYDALGRPTTLSRTIDGISYPLTSTYDSIGRVDRTVYPTNFQTRNVYNNFGFLKEVRRADSGKNDLYWMADRYAVSGQVEGETWGNGLTSDRVYSKATGRLRAAAVGLAPANGIQSLTYTYDRLGNVTTRSDGPTGRSESFGYDGLDRLTSHSVNGAAVTVAYANNGNITNKSDVGAYAYGTRPHAVTSAGGQSCAYDANGNMTEGANRSLTWTSFNQVLSIAQGGFHTNFGFGASHERVKQTSHLGTTIYVGSLYEKVTNGGATENKFYIYTPAGRSAVRVERSDATVETRYFHTDGLGSITAVTDEAGRVVKRFAFDAWGKRINPATNEAITSTTSGKFTRGFTDHEHLEDFGLIHMNGRVYDPVLGRFLSADPFIDDSTDSQSYNRYSYVSNNPLSSTDPSGYFKLNDALKIIAVIVVGVITAGAALYAVGIAGSFWGGVGMAIGLGGAKLGLAGAIAAGAGFGFGSSFAGSLLNGGSIGDAFKAGLIGALIGGVSAGITHGIGTLAQKGEWGWGLKATAHGLAQGGISEATGTDFRHGFYAGFFTSAAASSGITGRAPGGGTGRVTAAALIGGTASAIGGGKFVNGAVSGAFIQLFNEGGEHTRKTYRQHQNVKIKGIKGWSASGINEEPMNVEARITFEYDVINASDGTKDLSVPKVSLKVTGGSRGAQYYKAKIGADGGIGFGLGLEGSVSLEIRVVGDSQIRTDGSYYRFTGEYQMVVDKVKAVEVTFITSERTAEIVRTTLATSNTVSFETQWMPVRESPKIIFTLPK